ncbi:MAG: efflux RND transporter periplasmic adaptor subunit [Gammaproteobacteria bacterium]|nr:efflux RND transporter periplasmic adaptor subunit [Gammaproteobacteria bacterium]
MRARGPIVSTILASRTDLEQHVIASGRVWVVTRVQISSQISGRVLSVRAVEGQRVRAGDLLVQLDDAEANAAVSQASAAVNQSDARIEQLRSVGAIVTTEASRQAETNLARAELNLARIEKLFRSGDVPRVDFEEAQHNVEIARSQKNAAEVQKMASTPAGADSRIAASALGQNQAQLSAARVRLQQSRIVAPQDGIILSRMVEPGYTVQPGSTLIEMAAQAETQLAIEPDERNLAWIRVGQKALASADAYPQQTFEAQVSYIAPSVDPQRGSVQVRLRVPKPPSFLKPDMTVSVDLTVASKSNVVTVPSDAIRGVSTPDPWVLVIDQGLIARRSVKLGIRGLGRTEIESGIDQGAEIVLSDDQALLPGQRVRTERGTH